MPEWAAAVAGALWRRSALESTARRAVAARWWEVISHITRVKAFRERTGATAGWLRFPVVVNDSGALRDPDARRLGIMPGYEGILADLPLAPGRLVNAGPWPGAAQLASRLRTLPSHSLLRSRDMAAIVQRLEREERRRP
jgi:dTDP-4-amino-4,6-dideoxygalactose transaminase